MKERLKELIFENPMLIEINRFRRKFFDMGRGKTVNTMVIVVAAVAYACLLLIVANFAGDIHPTWLVFVQTGLFALLAPAMTYAMIAGERDRRSWDLLLAAPITHGQIVVGKMIAACAGILALAAAFMPPILFCAMTYKQWYGGSHEYMYGGYTGEVIRPQNPWGQLLQAEAISISFAILTCAMTLLFSARCRRAFMALGISLGAMFVGLIVYPVFASALGLFGYGAEDFVLYPHPFVALAKVAEPINTSGYGLPSAWFGWPHVAFYLLFTVIFVLWAERTLTFADGEKRFLPRSKHA